MTTRQAAKAIGCTQNHVCTLIRNGVIEARVAHDRCGNPYYQVSSASVLRYARKPQTKGWPRGRARKPQGAR